MFHYQHGQSLFCLLLSSIVLLSCDGHNTSSADTSGPNLVITEPLDINTYRITGSITDAAADVAWQLTVDSISYQTGSNGNGIVLFSGTNNVVKDSNYHVVVTAAPAGQLCSVREGTGVVAADVTNIVIHCVTELEDFNDKTVRSSAKR